MSDARAAVKVLIVDDREVNLLVLERLLEDLDVEVVRAGSGEDALARMLEHEFAVVLMDVQMPGMDGYETVDLMRRSRRTRHIPVVFVTASGREDAPAVPEDGAGPVDVLPKPVDPGLLRGKVRVFAELWELRREIAARDRRIDELSERLRALGGTDGD